MNREQNQQWLRGAAFLVATALGYTLCRMQNTLAGISVLFLLFPYITLWISESWIWGLSSLVATTGLLAFTAEPTLLWSCVPILSVAVPVSILIKQKKSYFSIFIVGALCFSLAILLSFWLRSALQGEDAFAELRHIFSSRLMEVLKMSVSSASPAMLVLLVQQWTSRFMSWLPAVYFCSGLFIIWVNALISVYCLSRAGHPVEPMRMGQLQMKRELGIALLILLFVEWLAAEVWNNSSAQIFFENTLIVAGSLFFLNGIAYLSLRFRRILFFFPLLILLLITFSMLFMVVVGIGIIDALTSVRTRLLLTSRPVWWRDFSDDS